MPIEGADKLLATLEKLRRLYTAGGTFGKVSAVTGYRANYAVYVHEAPMKLKGKPRRGGSGKGFYWDPQGRAKNKFLEDPARTLSSQIADRVTQTCLRTKNLGLGLLSGALLIQRASMLQVPIDTGNLRASAFSELEVPS